ncbi:FHA domain-containing protein [Vibrio sp. SCSIO 43140]|uniref:type VI secretion system-associated FHA domain protein n=1 Tax=Vibrio sp. SCSIO 43140 TaxID=2819100 RepID=UPI0020751E0B|nr:FHA domain-containing protein [Vibrio sp. SCSIO 43140]USD62287.1 FHA domain-containing protein [Vibrio sp. SCSIO 43140]
MDISFQLIELPENEQVMSRQITLPSEGGTIGRSYECTVQLPDLSRTLSRVHVEVRPHSEGGFQIIDRSVNGCQVNGVELGVGQSLKLNDGDNIRIGGYLMLVSDMEELFAEGSTNSSSQQNTEGLFPEKRETFDFDSVMEEPTEAIFAQDVSSSSSFKQEEVEAFSSENVVGEDIYSYDPFEDDDDLAMDLSSSDSKDNIVMITEHQNEPVADEHSVTVANGSQIQALDSSIDRLTKLVEHQQSTVTAAIDRERLFSCIEVTLDKFLDDFNPSSLEEEFDDYITGWGNKDKKYWSLYKKQFMRKQQKSEFKRQFTALLMEELREK